MAKEHRDKVANSEWALLDTLEVQMHLDDTEARHRKAKAVQVRANKASVDTSE